MRYTILALTTALFSRTAVAALYCATVAALLSHGIGKAPLMQLWLHSLCGGGEMAHCYNIYLFTVHAVLCT